MKHLTPVASPRVPLVLHPNRRRMELLIACHQGRVKADVNGSVRMIDRKKMLADPNAKGVTRVGSAIAELVEAQWVAEQPGGYYRPIALGLEIIKRHARGGDRLAA